VKVALRIRPQQSTQYGRITRRLAEPELRASPAAAHLEEIRTVELGGQPYVLASVRDGTSLGRIVPGLSRLGACSELFEHFERIGDVEGPLLRPLARDFVPHVPVEMAEARRYKGKTSDVFSHVLLNLALFAGAFAEERRARVLDPLCGGGTTLFLALAHGHDALGIDNQRSDVDGTAGFARGYFKEERISFAEVKERTVAGGTRWRFEAGTRTDRRLLVLVAGDARDAAGHLHGVPGGARVHAIAGDLPYGIQHDGEVTALLREALPAWAELLLPGGAVALAWNATRLSRARVTDLVAASGLEVRDDGPYADLSHQVDRVIKQRDVVVAVRPAPTT
jgi:SAM-dependent methyltransferase